MSSHLSPVYDTTVINEPTNHIGVVVSHGRSNFSLTLTQPAYITEMLDKLNISVPDKAPRYPMNTD